MPSKFFLPYQSLRAGPSLILNRCQGDKKDIDGDLSRLPRTHELTKMLVTEWAVSDLWGKFSIVSDIMVSMELNFILSDVVFIIHS